MKTRSLILLASAITLAAGAALVGRSLMRPPPPVTIVKEVPVAAPPKAPSRFVLTVSDTLSAGQYLKPEQLIKAKTLSWQETPGDEIGGDALSAVTLAERRQIERDLAGAAMRATLDAGQPLTRDALVYPVEPGFLATVLKPGMRAVAIPTSATGSNAGLVSPDDRVDVILSLQRSELESPMPPQSMPNGVYYALASQTIVRNVRVLAVNNNPTAVTPQEDPETPAVDKNGKRNQADPAKRNPRLIPAPNTLFYESLTLEVAPADAERLALATEVGTLQVALLSAQEDKPDLTISTVPTRLPETAALFQGTSPRVVDAYRGDKQEKHVFSKRP